MQITYQEINAQLLEKIAAQYGEWAKKHVHIGDDSFSLAALCDGVPVGFISTYTCSLAAPVGEEKDAYIDIIEVDERFRRMGIAFEMVTRTEEWAKGAGLLQIRAWSSQDKREAIAMWRSLGYGLCPAKIWVEWCKRIVDGYYVVKPLNPINPYPDLTRRIRQEVQSASGKRIHGFRLIRAQRGVSVYRCLYDGVHAVVKHFEKEEDRREILNYRILTQQDIPTIKVLFLGESTLVMEDVARWEDWRLGVPEDLEDVAVARSLASWYFALHEKGGAAPERDALYFEYDGIQKKSLELLSARLPEASALFEFLISNFAKLYGLIYKPAFTLTYNDFYWTNFVVRKDKQAAMMFDYNLLGKGYRYADLRNVGSALSETANKAFAEAYERLYFRQHGCGRQAEERMEKRIDEVVAPLFSLMAAFEQERFPSWAEDARTEALNGTLLSKAKRLLA